MNKPDEPFMDTVCGRTSGDLLTAAEADAMLNPHAFVDQTIKISGTDFFGTPVAFSFVDTAEDQRRRYELSEWIRECWYAGILGVDLPPAPPWYVEPRMITGIVCEPARTRRRGQSPFAMKSRR